MRTACPRFIAGSCSGDGVTVPALVSGFGALLKVLT